MESRRMQRPRASVPSLDGACRVALKLDGEVGAASQPTFRNYLRANGFRLHSIAPRPRLRAQALHLPALSFVHARLPEMDLEWIRSSASAERSVVVLPIAGSLRVSGDSSVTNAKFGSYFVLPGRASVSIRVNAPATEVVYICLDARTMQDIQGPDVLDDAVSRSRSGLAPMLRLVGSLCSAPIKSKEDAAPLHGVANEVARSLVRGLAAEQLRPRTLYDRAIALIAADQTNPKLSVSDIADRLDVSLRRLQQAFEEHGTSVSAELRRLRTAAAVETRRRNPELTFREIAAATGFGSVSTLRRALDCARAGRPEPAAATTLESQDRL